MKTIDNSLTIGRLHDDHQRIIALVHRLAHFLRRDTPPIELEFAQLRWTLLRELTHHHAAEQIVFRRIAQPSVSVAASGNEATAALNAHMAQWTATAIQQSWPSYCSAARMLLRQIEQQVQGEESVMFPRLRALFNTDRR